MQDNNHFDISDGIDGSAINYTVMYYDSVSSTICCSSAIVQASTCEELACMDMLNISSSTCSSGVDINVTAYATNLLGNSPTSEFDTVGEFMFKYTMKYYYNNIHFVLNVQMVSTTL